MAALTRPLTVLFHELGHAIPAILLTNDHVTLYIGSYGDPKKSLTLRIGRVEFFFKYNPILWNLGLCVPHSKEISVNRQIIITIFGPLTSLLLGTFFCYTAFILDVHGSLKAVSVFLLGSSILDFFINVVPRDEPIQLYDGTIVYNDGQQLKQLFKYKTLPSQYTLGTEYYNNQEYEKAAKVFHGILANGVRSETVYRLTIFAYLQFEAYTEALQIQREFEKYCKLNSDDYAISGLIKAQLEHYEEGMSDFQKSLNLDPEHKYALNNRGYTHNCLRQYDKSIEDFDKVIELDPEFAHSYNNRGLAKIKLGQEEEGLKDIEISMRLDDKNSFVYRNLGIHRYDREEFYEALEFFEKASALDPDTHLLKSYIAKTKEKLKKTAHNKA